MARTRHGEPLRAGPSALGAVAPAALPAVMQVPNQAAALVLLAMGTATLRASAAGERLAQVLHGHGLATLRVDAPATDLARQHRDGAHAAPASALFDSTLDTLARRVDLASLRTGLFGAGLATAVALRVAATRPGLVGALVCCGGRPDRASAWLDRIDVPTLLIVGSNDSTGLQQHRDALRHIGCTRRLELIPGAGPKFMAPGALESVAELAAAWFERHLAGR